MRRALSTLLRTIGYSTVAFASPTEFLSEYDPNRPSCVLLDVHMPGMSGLEVQEHLIRSGSMLSVIFMTGHGDVRMAVQAMKNGAVGFLEKPFNNDELLDLLKFHCKWVSRTDELFLPTSIKPVLRH
ncbi:MAG: response regulator transcription factor [Steroidobacter sp.]|nr:response regulator transcription factor [Steroidobacter sp.]